MINDLKSSIRFDIVLSMSDSRALSKIMAVCLAVVGSLLGVTGCASLSDTTGATVENAPTKSVRREDREIYKKLSGKTWLLAGYRTRGQFIPLEPGHATTARIIFTVDGRIEGTTGINTFSGICTGTITGNAETASLKISVTDKTKDEAPNEIAAQFEADLLHLFIEVRSIQMKQNSISLLNEKGDILLRFIFIESSRE